MDYGNYHPDMNDYYGMSMDPRSVPPMHYAPYSRPPMPPMKLEPIVPHENDILMGRGGKNNQHVGNEKLRKLARLEAKAYSTSSKKIKSNIARGLVMKVRNMQPAGRFLKRNAVTSEWEDVGNEYAREKASQVLRDAVALLPEASEEDSQDKKPEATESASEEAPELKSEPQDTRRDTPLPAAKRQRLMTPATVPPAYYSSYATASPAWQYQTPMTPTALTPPTLKRLRSNNWFERAAFFNTPNTPSTPTITNLARQESGRSFGANLSYLAGLSPTSLSRQGSLCASLGNGPLPGENFLLTSNHERQDLDLGLVDSSSDEFLSDFY